MMDDQLASISDLSATNNSNIIGFVDGNPYTGDFIQWIMDIKMTGIFSWCFTDQIIYSTIAESHHQFISFNCSAAASAIQQLVQQQQDQLVLKAVTAAAVLDHTGSPAYNTSRSISSAASSAAGSSAGSGRSHSSIRINSHSSLQLQFSTATTAQSAPAYINSGSAASLAAAAGSSAAAAGFSIRQHQQQYRLLQHQCIKFF